MQLQKSMGWSNSRTGRMRALHKAKSFDPQHSDGPPSKVIPAKGDPRAQSEELALSTTGWVSPPPKKKKQKVPMLNFW